MARRSAKKGACCAGRDIHDARRVAEAMGFPHYVLDYENIFREAVIDEFADSYLAGATPVPCIRCNERVKFRDLLETARDLDADCMATGHYIRREMGAAGPGAAPRGRPGARPVLLPVLDDAGTARLPALPARRPGDEGRDPRARRAATACRSPTSPTARTSASSRTATTPRVIEKLRPGAAEPGEIVHVDGRVLGRHAGVIHYTVGQRRGLGIGGLDEPLYVVQLDVDAPPRRSSARRRCSRPASSRCARSTGWATAPFDGAAERHVSVKVRSTRPPARGDPAPAVGNRGRGRAAHPRGRRLPRPGLRLLRPRRHPGPRRRLDLARPLRPGRARPSTSIDLQVSRGSRAARAAGAEPPHPHVHPHPPSTADRLIGSNIGRSCPSSTKIARPGIRRSVRKYRTPWVETP